jgi:plastocyanin
MMRCLFVLMLVFLTACAPKTQDHQGHEGMNPTTALTDCPDTILIKSFAFEPANCKVALGRTLTFINEDSVPHTATALFNAPAKFDTGDLATKASVSIRFDTAASIPYHCEIHPSMTGTIVVEP